MTELTEGTKAPGFELAGADGPVRLSDFAGKSLVIYFYPKDDTSGCTKEAQEFSALSGEFAAAGTQVLGVSKDTVASHGKFTAKYDLKVPLGSDPEGSMIEAGWRDPPDLAEGEGSRPRGGSPEGRPGPLTGGPGRNHRVAS